MAYERNQDSNSPQQRPRGGRFIKGIALTALASVALAMAPAQADGPGRGQTAQFERDYLSFIIDHHYSALRMTELAAGTDLQRDPAVNNPQEGTSPTPGTAATPPKAGMEDIKSMARMANRMQREEILKAQKLLKDWYGATHTPTVRTDGQQLIQVLEQTAGGAQFEQAFLQLFSNHHYAALHPSLDCQVKRDIDHHELKEYCEGIVQGQVREINDMRDMLCKQFSICDYQPTTGARVQASATATSTRQ
ncbi:DUF305 domain-containing protein [Noviherbaspirillum sp. CPCC 100848]|uniref:DUF305 domain-containing protein n=1 Tax=Noviherbaspirillum album TaxID=3080276 RepID=A0ABU6J467_9BURK|nr:DUF305 domain-containing protein [Noviherbaspirillum sp. CPCC 100848]MEC4718122.1 DUF305 domain-containing protein [Noviherbaspirillum sp. CPCC 100848]